MGGLARNSADFRRKRRGAVAWSALLLLGLLRTTDAQREKLPSAPTPPVETNPVETDAVETYPIELWLQTQVGPKESARPAPGIHVEIGIRDSSRAVELDSRPLDLHLPVLATATSDAQGELRVTVPVPLEWRRRSAFLWARVETPGLQRSVQYFQPRVTPQHERLRVWPGGTLLGRALDESGAPLAGARVSIQRTDDRDSKGRYGDRRTLPDGSFALPFGEAGRYGIHVRDDERGSSPRFELELDPARVPEPVELTIRGGPAVAGRLLDPDGEPIAGAWLIAVPVGHAPAPTPAARFEAERSGGLLGGMAQTNLEGRFELPALLPGTYEFHLSWRDDELAGESSTSLSASRLGPSIGQLAVESGRQDLVLVHRAHRMEVSVRAADGTPVLPRRNAKGALELPGLSLQGLTDEYEYPRPTFVGERVVFPVEPEHQYLLRWQESSVPLLERRIVVDARPYRVSVPLVLGPRGEPAQIAVHVLDPSGAPFWLSNLTLVSLETGIEVSQSVGFRVSHATRKDSVWTLTLPPGRYLLQASSEALADCVTEYPLPRTPFLAAQRECELIAGQQEPLELRLGAAGHLDFECARPGTAPGEREARAFWRGLSVIDPEQARHTLRGAELWFVGDERRVPIGSFVVEGLPSSPLTWLLPGWPARGLDPLPPGEWTLSAERSGKVLFQTRVRIAAGEVTSVRW